MPPRTQYSQRGGILIFLSLFYYLFISAAFRDCIEKPCCFFHLFVAECLNTHSTPVVVHNRTTLSTPKRICCICEDAQRNSEHLHRRTVTSWCIIVKKFHDDVWGVKVISRQNALWDMFRHYECIIGIIHTYEHAYGIMFFCINRTSLINHWDTKAIVKHFYLVWKLSKMDIVLE